MKLSVLTTAILLSAFSANSQDADISLSPDVKNIGYILTQDGDTIPKLISIMSSTKIITYDLEGNKKSKEVYKASKLTAFNVGNYYFEAHKYKNVDIVNASAASLATPPKYYFMLKILTGKINVLQHTYADADGNTLGKFLLKKGDDKLRTRAKLLELVSDCSEVYAKVENMKDLSITDEQIIETVMDYNNNCK